MSKTLSFGPAPALEYLISRSFGEHQRTSGCDSDSDPVAARRRVHHGDTEGPLIADWRLRISDLELMNSFSIRTIRNPQSAIRNPQSAIQRVLRASQCSPCLRGE